MKNKCGDCIFIDLKEPSRLGFLCKRPWPPFRTRNARWKRKHCYACSSFEAREKNNG